jgi:hypothetical protein
VLCSLSEAKKLLSSKPQQRPPESRVTHNPLVNEMVLKVLRSKEFV